MEHSMAVHYNIVPASLLVLGSAGKGSSPVGKCHQGSANSCRSSSCTAYSPPSSRHTIRQCRARSLRRRCHSSHSRIRTRGCGAGELWQRVARQEVGELAHATAGMEPEATPLWCPKPLLRRCTTTCMHVKQSQAHVLALVLSACSAWVAHHTVGSMPSHLAQSMGHCHRWGTCSWVIHVSCWERAGVEQPHRLPHMLHACLLSELNAHHKRVAAAAGGI